MAWERIGEIRGPLTHVFDFDRYRYRFTLSHPTANNETVKIGNTSIFNVIKGSPKIIAKGDPEVALMNGRTTLTVYHVLSTVYVDRELVNNAPSVTITTEDARTLYENDTLNITGTAQDADSGNTVTVKYSINNGTARILDTFVSDGSVVSFNKPLTFKRDKLHDGTTAVTGDLQEGVTHTLRVWAEDDQGGKSTVHSRTFNVIPNRPEVKVNGQSRVVETVYCKVNGQAREVVKMWTKVNGELREV